MPDDTVSPTTPILLAGGDQDSLNRVREMLEEFQFQEITLVHEGNEVLSIEESNVFGLILVVSHLTDLSPPKVVAALRAGGKNSQTPILYLHRPEEKQMADRALAAGASLVLPGPWEEKELRGAVEKSLGKKIITRKEEQERATRFLEAADEGIARVKSLRTEGKFEEGETAFLEALEGQLLLLSKMYEAKGEKEKAQAVLTHAEEKFPGIRDREAGSSHPPQDKQDRGGSDGVRLERPILIAERIPEDLAEVERILGEFQLTNYRVVRDAVSILREDENSSFGLILLSSALAGMSALKVVAALRAGELNVKTPILVLHGPSETSLVAETKAAGASDAVVKPVTAGALRSSIESVLGAKIVTRSEAKEHSAYFLQAVTQAGEVLKILQASKILDGSERPLLERMRDLFLVLLDLYSTQGQKRQAESLLDESRKVFPGIRETWRRWTEGYVQRGNEALQRGEFRVAWSEFCAALSLKEEGLDALIGLGEACIGLGDSEGAKSA
ncbi:MAG: response regulator, partial [Nitrospinota bacterium]